MRSLGSSVILLPAISFNLNSVMLENVCKWKNLMTTGRKVARIVVFDNVLVPMTMVASLLPWEPFQTLYNPKKVKRKKNGKNTPSIPCTADACVSFVSTFAQRFVLHTYWQGRGLQWVLRHPARSVTRVLCGSTHTALQSTQLNSKGMKSGS